MVERKQRTLSYRRARWFEDAVAKDLETLIRGCLSKYSSVASTRIERDDDSVVEIAHRRVKSGEPVYLHICLYAPGEGASTIPNLGTGAEVDLGVASAPAGTDFLDGDAMILIKGSDVVLCTSAMHEAAVAKYLRDLVERSQQGKGVQSFDLLRIANREVVDNLIKHGVKKITLDIHAFEQTLNPVNPQSRSDLSAAKSGVSSLFGALIKRDGTPAEIMDASQLEAAVTIRADMRRQGGAEVVAGEVASKVLDLFDFGYEIETVSGIKITSDEIAIRGKFSFPVDGKTVHYRPVWDQLAKFYNKILQDGINAE